MCFVIRTSQEHSTTDLDKAGSLEVESKHAFFFFLKQMKKFIVQKENILSEGQGFWGIQNHTEQNRFKPANNGNKPMVDMSLTVQPPMTTHILHTYYKDCLLM